MKDSLYTILAFISIIASIGAFIIFWVGKVLNLRKEIIELQMNSQFDRRRIEELEKDLEQLQRWYNEGRNN